MQSPVAYADNTGMGLPVIARPGAAAKLDNNGSETVSYYITSGNEGTAVTIRLKLVEFGCVWSIKVL